MTKIEAKLEAWIKKNYAIDRMAHARKKPLITPLQLIFIFAVVIIVAAILTMLESLVKGQ